MNRYALLKTLARTDDPVYVEDGKYTTVTFPQLSSYVPDDFNFSDQLPNKVFTINYEGILHLQASLRFYEAILDQEPFTVVTAMYANHYMYNRPKLIGKQRVVTNGPGDISVPSSLFAVNADTRIWLDVWQENSTGQTLQLEYAYMGVDLEERRL